MVRHYRQGYHLGVGMDKAGTSFFAVVLEKDDRFKPSVFLVMLHTVAQHHEDLGDLPVFHVHHLAVLDRALYDDLMDPEAPGPGMNPLGKRLKRQIR